jgi:hypothetical protein
MTRTAAANAPARQMRKGQLAGVNPLDLDALKAAGLNSDEVSQRLLEQHERGERMDVQRAIAQKVGRRS